MTKELEEVVEAASVLANLEPLPRYKITTSAVADFMDFVDQMEDECDD